ncbi:MAG TPA: BlaI/MecI/CopY family transcriptional regulator [Marinagarivorans sp.]
MTQHVPNAPVLGELEIDVLDTLWAEGELSAKDMHQRIVTRRKVSANSVQAAMERLYRKGILSRTKLSHRYLYQPTVPREKLLGSLINDLVARFQADALSSTAAFLNAAEQLDETALDLLEAEIRRRRSERKP